MARSLEFLSSEGGSKLRIDRLVEHLGVTKGSFYWHFKDRADFVRSLVEYWDEYSTQRVIDHVSPVVGSPEDRLLALIEIVVKEELGRYDLAVRGWAIEEPAVALRLAVVDERRLSFVRDLFKEMGFRGVHLEMRARALAHWLNSEYTIFARQPVKDRLEQLRLLHELLTRS